MVVDDPAVPDGEPGADAWDIGIVLGTNPAQRDGEGVVVLFFEIEGTNNAPGGGWSTGMIGLGVGAGDGRSAQEKCNGCKKTALGGVGCLGILNGPIARGHMGFYRLVGGNLCRSCAELDAMIRGV